MVETLSFSKLDEEYLTARLSLRDQPLRVKDLILEQQAALRSGKRA